MMIEKIEGIQKDWKKPWFTEGALQWPRNLHGREYNGMNAFMLLLHCEKEGYKIPRFCTFDCVQKLNKSGKDVEELTEKVLHEARVFITPGFIFGSNGARYIRISLCCKDNKLAEALERIKRIKRIKNK